LNAKAQKALRAVRLENVEFEKKFDVYCANQIYSRKVLTPEIVYKMYDFSNLIDSSRKYEMMFSGKYVFIKIDLINTNMF
jgi:hypothetical protein